MPPFEMALDIDTDAALREVLRSGGRILIVLVLALVAAGLVRRLVRPLIAVAIREQMAGKAEAEVVKRIETLSDVIYRTAVIGIALVALVTVLPEFGINAGPLIAGLGLVGIAVGFGAQNLVRDLINGVQILLENQYGRGDYVRLGTVSGIVVDMNLRRTVLRDFEGVVHFVSHGNITIVSNYTRGYSRVLFNVVLSYGVDLRRVYDVIDRVGAELAADPDYAARIREAPRARGVDRLGEGSIDVRVEGVTEPGAQWDVTAEMRRRLLLALEAEGIKLKA